MTSGLPASCGEFDEGPCYCCCPSVGRFSGYIPGDALIYVAATSFASTMPVPTALPSLGRTSEYQQGCLLPAACVRSVVEHWGRRAVLHDQKSITPSVTLEESADSNPLQPLHFSVVRMGEQHASSLRMAPGACMRLLSGRVGSARRVDSKDAEDRRWRFLPYL